MHHALRYLSLLLLAAWLPVAAPADEANDLFDEIVEEETPETREVEAGVLYDDFESGYAGAIEVDTDAARKPKQVVVVDDGGRKALELQGSFHSRVFFANRVYRDCIVETRVKKTAGNYAGIVVRDTVFVFFQMRGALSVTRQHEGLLFQSADSFKNWQNLRVVCIGPLLRAYIDDRLICTVNIGLGEGRVGFYGHGNGTARYDHFRVTTHVEPALGLHVQPRSASGALLFAPGEPFGLQVAVTNYAAVAQLVELNARPFYWGGEGLANAAARVTVEPGAETTVTLPIEALPAGFFRGELTATSGDISVAMIDDLPLAIQSVPEVRYQQPVLPIAVYSKYFGKRDPLWQGTYAHAVARILREHHINAIVADPSFRREDIDIYARYGIATIARSGAHADHPAVIATLASDEPKADAIPELKQTYQSLTESTGKPVTTCLVGEGMGLGGANDPVNLWQQLDAQLRSFRWYGIKKSHYNLLHDVKYKGVLPLGSVLRIVEASAPTDWWFVPPSFGATQHEGYYMNPTPAEMRGLMHMAMAYGADGMMLWCLQGWGKWVALLEQESLAAPDGKLTAVGKAAALLAQHADLLAALEPGSFTVRNSDPIHIEAVPRQRGELRYLYVVNKDAAQERTATLQIEAVNAATLTDHFGGGNLPVQAGAVTLTLGPCEAALLALGRQTAMSGADAQEAHPPAVLASVLTQQIQTALADSAVAVVLADIEGHPCTPGDAIGLSRQDDPRRGWDDLGTHPPCLSWGGGIHERPGSGYLPLASAQRLADAYPRTHWTAYPAAGNVSANELRAMLHLALAYGSKAVLAPRNLSGDHAAVVEEVAGLLDKHGQTIAQLTHAGLDIRCKDARLAVIPRGLPSEGEKGISCVYAVNLDTEATITAELLLWDDVWAWTTAQHIFTGQALEVQPRGDGYLACTVTLAPGQGALILTDAHVEPRR